MLSSPRSVDHPCLYSDADFFFLVWNLQARTPITSETHTDGGAVIRKPGSAWLEGTPAMDLGHMNVVVKWMYLHVGSGLRNWSGSHHQGSAVLSFLGFEDPS